MEVKDIKKLLYEVKENKIKEKGIIQYWEDRWEQTLLDEENPRLFGVPRFRYSRRDALLSQFLTQCHKNYESIYYNEAP